MADLRCPLGGDETNDCEGCCYSPDYHFVDGECVVRETKDCGFNEFEPGRFTYNEFSANP